MVPKPWATAEQKLWLLIWMPDFIKQQVEEEGWFQRYPEEKDLKLPLPTDQDKCALTLEEVLKLSTAILVRKGSATRKLVSKPLQKKIGTADTNITPTSTATIVQRILQQGLGVAKRRHAHQSIEIFQKRNPAAIKEALVEAGYDLQNVKQDVDDENNWTNEFEGTPAARLKLTKSDRMCLWAKASPEERAVVTGELEAEKNKLHEEELHRELSPDDITPEQQQHVYFSETAAGNDFEACCMVANDRPIERLFVPPTPPATDKLKPSKKSGSKSRKSKSKSKQKASAVVGKAGSTLPASDTEEDSLQCMLSVDEQSIIFGERLADAAVSSWDHAKSPESETLDLLHDKASGSAASLHDEAAPLRNELGDVTPPQDDSISNNVTPLPPSQIRPVGMTAPLSLAEAGVLAAREGGINPSTLAIDPMLQELSYAPTPSMLMLPSQYPLLRPVWKFAMAGELDCSLSQRPPARGVPIPPLPLTSPSPSPPTHNKDRIVSPSVEPSTTTPIVPIPSPLHLPVIPSPPGRPLLPVVPPLPESRLPVNPVLPVKAPAKLLTTTSIIPISPPSCSPVTPPLPVVSPLPESCPPVNPILPAKALPKRQKKAIGAKAAGKEAPAAGAKKVASVVEVVKRKPGIPRKTPLDNITDAIVGAEAAPPVSVRTPVVYTSTNNNWERAHAAAETEKAAKVKEVEDALARQATKGWVQSTVDGAMIVTLTPLNPLMRACKATKYSDRSPVPAVGTMAALAAKKKLNTSEAVLLVWTETKTGARRKASKSEVRQEPFCGTCGVGVDDLEGKIQFKVHSAFHGALKVHGAAYIGNKKKGQSLKKLWMGHVPHHGKRAREQQAQYGQQHGGQKRPVRWGRGAKTGRGPKQAEDCWREGGREARKKWAGGRWEVCPEPSAVHGVVWAAAHRPDGGGEQGQPNVPNEPGGAGGGSGRGGADPSVPERSTGSGRQVAKAGGGEGQAEAEAS
ncbi:hypothetical protein K438DRAFT_1772183 [Mycena galopus ATCC 62051]|nr:hypothetical protein K438DRAFT_1772183 [Mycena galopus ATCC 62051]